MSIRYSERLAEADVEPSVGSKAELIHGRVPWKTKEAVELATLDGSRGSTTIACWSPSAASRLRGKTPGEIVYVPGRDPHFTSSCF